MSTDYKISAVLLCGALLAGCAGIQTSSWQAPSNKLADAETYNWAEDGLQTAGEIPVDREFVTPLIVSAVETILNEKGYRKAEENASILLGPSVQIMTKEMRVVSQTDETPSTQGMLRRAGTLDWEPTIPEQVSVEVYEEGTVLLTVTDAASGKTLWQGSSSLRVDRNRSPERKERLVKKAVRALMASFPERPGAGL